MLSQIQQQRWTAQELQDELSQVVQRAEKLWSLQGAGRECGARCNNLKTALQNREVPENKQHNLRQLKYASMTSFLSTEMADFLVMPSSLSMSPSIRTGKSLSPRRRQYTGSRHSPHPQLRKPISLLLFYIRRQRKEIPLVHYSLQSN